MPIAFDVRTIFFFGAMAAFACAALMWASRALHAPSRDGLVWAAGSLAAYGAAMMLIALRGAVPDFLSWPVANALGTGGAPLMYEGVRRLVGARPRPALAWGTLVALGLVQAAIGIGPQGFALRLQITSVVQGGFAAASVALLVQRLRLGVDPPRQLRWAIGLLGAFTAGHAARFVLVLGAGAPVSVDGFAHGPLQAAMPTMFALAPMAFALVLIGLVNGRLAAELWTLATVDTLTGVRTRRAFIDEARRTLAEGGRPVLLMLDLDRFKQVNDLHGHACGDRVLVRFAELLRDAVPTGSVVGRYGGEEFCLLMRDAPAELGLARARALCETVRGAAFGFAGPGPSITVSIGLATAADGTTLEELLLAADRRLYLAKASGRDRVVASDRPHAPDPWAAPTAGSTPPIAAPGRIAVDATGA